MDILDDMGVSKLSAKVFLKVNYSFKFLRENIQGVYIEKKLHLIIFPVLHLCMFCQ